MKKLLIFAFLILFGAYVATRFYYFDLSQPNKCIVKIFPSFMPSNFNTREVLRFVKKNDPENYGLLCNNVTKINKNPKCGGIFHGGCVYNNEPTVIHLNNDLKNVATVGSVIVHEICHVLQIKENRQIEEPECYAVGEQFLQKVIMY